MLSTPPPTTFMSRPPKTSTATPGAPQLLSATLYFNVKPGETMATEIQLLKSAETELSFSQSPISAPYVH